MASGRVRTSNAGGAALDVDCKQPDVNGRILREAIVIYCQGADLLMIAGDR